MTFLTSECTVQYQVYRMYDSFSCESFSGELLPLTVHYDAVSVVLFCTWYQEANLLEKIREREESLSSSTT